MNSIIEDMLNQYQAENIEDQKNAIKEIMQEIVLSGLARAGFFKEAAFYGGTALRIFYGLDRFSEDLDFSLIAPNESFDLTNYFPVLEKEIKSYGLNMEIREKIKAKDSNIKSAFLKGNTLEHMLLFYANEDIAGGIAKNESLKIKFEIDTNPPSNATFETRYSLRPTPYEIQLYDLPSLFAGKIHAVLCRAWKSRIKGRDLYDYVFYLSKGASVNIEHLKSRLVQSDAYPEDKELTIDIVKELLVERFATIDYDQAKDDVRQFIKDPKVLDIWSAEFFCQITKQLK